MRWREAETWIVYKKRTSNEHENQATRRRTTSVFWPKKRIIRARWQSIDREKEKHVSRHGRIKDGSKATPNLTRGGENGRKRSIYGEGEI